MGQIITIAGIDEAISNLRFNKKALKYKLIQAIRERYEDEASVESIVSVESDELIKQLWETGDDAVAVKNKRKNLSSIKSSVNAALSILHDEGKNSEGISIGPANVFVMSDEAKTKILERFKYDTSGESPVPLVQIMDVLQTVNDIISRPDGLTDEDANDQKMLDQLKEIIQDLSARVGLDGPRQTVTGSGIGKGSGKDNGVRGGIPVKAEAGTGQGIDLPMGEVGLGEQVFEGDLDDKELIEDEESEVDFEEIEVAEDDDFTEEEDKVEDLDEEIITENEEATYEETETDAGTGIDFPKSEEGLEAGVPEGGPGGEGLTEGVEAEEDLEGLELEEDDDLEEVDMEEDFEDLEVVNDGNLEEEVDPEEPEGSNISLVDLLEKYSDAGFKEEDGIRQAKILAERFNDALGAMDKYYNQYILIPEGEYITGSKFPKKNERPEKKIYLEPFYFGKFPVINALFEVFIEKTGYETTAERLGYSTVYYGRYQRIRDKRTGQETFHWNSSLIRDRVDGACWYQPFGPGSTLHNKRIHPVVHVSREDAMAFAAWTGKRLPTEDEWEAASRTAKGYELPQGNELKPDLCNIEESYIGDTTPVDKYKKYANDFGIFDTIGNIMEWSIPSFGSPSRHMSNEEIYYFKGGSWISNNDICLFSRVKTGSETHSNIIGFRCVAY